MRRQAGEIEVSSPYREGIIRKSQDANTTSGGIRARNSVPVFAGDAWSFTGAVIKIAVPHTWEPSPGGPPLKSDTVEREIDL